MSCIAAGSRKIPAGIDIAATDNDILYPDAGSSGDAAAQRVPGAAIPAGDMTGCYPSDRGKVAAGVNIASGSAAQS